MQEALIEFKIRLIGTDDVIAQIIGEFIEIGSDESVYIKVDDVLSVIVERQARHDASTWQQVQDVVCISIMTKRRIVYRLYCEGGSGGMVGAKRIVANILHAIRVYSIEDSGVEKRTADLYSKKKRRMVQGIDALED